MTINERLEFFKEMLRCNYDVYLWTYTPELELIHTNCPQDLVISDASSILDFADTLQEYVTSGKRTPIWLDSSMGLLYISVFEYEDAELKHIHMLGPILRGKNSHLLIKKDLDSRTLSVKLRSKIFRQIDQIPVMPSSSLYQYTLMFHYAVTGEKITTADISYPQGQTSDSNDLKLISDEHAGIWKAEQEMLQMFREGSPDYRKALGKSTNLSSGVKFDIGDSLRKQKNDVIVLLVLCSRASIEGGLNPSIAYTLNDYYMQKLEEAKSASTINNLTHTMLEDFMQRVRSAKQTTDVSSQIQNICDYISVNPREKFSIAELAERTGYTEYYFSHKFKKEIGISIADFIKQVKLEKAKLLLSATTMNIQEISDELAFGSRSYFSSSFQKAFGMSPSDYRNKNTKL